MIRKLRLKIVGISVIAVAVLLVSVLAAVALSTRSQMVRASESRLQEALAGHMLSGAQPGSGGGQPCFVADIYADGTVRLAGSGYYDLDNDALILSIVQDALQRESREGVLQDYALRYMRQTGTLTVRLAFTDCSQEQATMRSLLLRMGGVSLAALLLLTGVSYWLAGFAVKPVQQAWQEQKQFVSDASHELKTPLTVILSSAELAASETDGEKSRQYLDNIHAESLRMKDLVENMLTLARTESGTRLPEEAVDLSDTVLESALAFEPVAFENRKPMEYTVQPELTVSGRSGHSAGKRRKICRARLPHSNDSAPGGTKRRAVGGKPQRPHPAGEAGAPVRPVLPSGRVPHRRRGLRAGPGHCPDHCAEPPGQHRLHQRPGRNPVYRDIAPG